MFLRVTDPRSGVLVGRENIGHWPVEGPASAEGPVEGTGRMETRDERSEAHPLRQRHAGRAGAAGGGVAG